MKTLNIATGGSKGVGDIVGRNFCEEQEIINKGQGPKIFHIIPEVTTVSYFYLICCYNSDFIMISFMVCLYCMLFFFFL